MNKLNIRIGLGYDVHSFADNRDLIIGGIQIPFKKGLLGHSDADVLLHAVIDSILGAANLGDIGRLFPDTDENFKDISSLLLLQRVALELNKAGYHIVNIDSVVICEKPKIGPYVDDMRKAISSVLDSVSIENISIKGKTTEKLGFTGREEGIAAQAICLISKNV